MRRMMNDQMYDDECNLNINPLIELKLMRYLKQVMKIQTVFNKHVSVNHSTIKKFTHSRTFLIARKNRLNLIQWWNVLKERMSLYFNQIRINLQKSLSALNFIKGNKFYHSCFT